MAYKRKSPFPRVEAINLVKRLVKPDSYQPKVDMVLFYKIFAENPDIEFWRVYDLGFQLNSMAWFLTEEGKEKLKIDMALFHLDIPTEKPYTLEDNITGPNIETKPIKKTIADLFK